LQQKKFFLVAPVETIFYFSNLVLKLFLLLNKNIWQMTSWKGTEAVSMALRQSAQ
jgi:hypothetical protein